MVHTGDFLSAFQAMVGDPTGQSERARPNARASGRQRETYLDRFTNSQQGKHGSPLHSEWLGKLTSYEIVRLCAH